MSNNYQLAEIRTMATSVAKSGMFGLKNPEQAFTLMLIAEAEGIPPISAVQKYSVINGMPSLKSTEIQARFQRANGKIEWIETTNEKAVCKLTHEQGGTYTSEFTMEDAKRMGLASKDNYKRMPKQMMMARAVSMGVRAIYPSCLNNMYSVEEAQDIEPVEIVENAEVETVEVTEDNTKELKLALFNKLKGFTDDIDIIRTFAEFSGADRSKEILEKLVSDENYFNEVLEKFESGE